MGNGFRIGSIKLSRRILVIKDNILYNESAKPNSREIDVKKILFHSILIKMGIFIGIDLRKF